MFRSAISRHLGRRAFASAPEIFTAAPTQVSTLSSGLRVATQRTGDASATVGVWIDSGSRNETKETNGVAHFLEHMAFKGTTRRSRSQFETEIEDMGGHLNAYTSREQTVYYAKTFTKDVPRALEILADILTNSTYDAAAMEQERHVILREMEEVEKSFEEVIFDRLHMTAFRDSPLGFTILGPTANIQSFSKAALQDYVARNYTADRMVVAAVGDVDHKTVVAETEKLFGKFKASQKGLIEPPREKPYFCGSELVEKNDEMGPVAHIAVGFEGVSWNAPEVPAFMVMQSILGSYSKAAEGIVPGTLSGNRMTHAMAHRQNVGCTEAYSAFNTCYKDTGLFGVYAQADEVAVEHCIGEVMFGIGQLSYSVTEEEVERAKKILKTQLFGSLDTTTAIAEDIGRQLLLYGRRINMAEFAKRIDAVDAEEVKRVAWNHLHDKEIAVAAIGPLHGMPNYLNIRRQTFWHRY